MEKSLDITKTIPMNFPTLSSTPSEVKRFADLSEWELNDLVKQRHSDKTKKELTNWPVSTFRGEYV